MFTLFELGLIFMLLGPMMVVRALRWLSFVQQKEYRLDRLWELLSSRQGIFELARIFALPNDLTRAGLKRPHVTLRIMFVTIVAIVLSLVGLQWGFNGIIFIWLSLPFIIILSAWLSGLGWWALTEFKLRQASQKITQAAPFIIGVTGSYGKTSTKHLIAHVLSTQQPVFTTPRSHNTKYSVAQAILRSYAGEKLVVLEYAAYTKGEIKKLAEWFHPDAAVITGLAPQHLALFGSVEAIIKAKSELVKALPEKAPIFVNAADSGTVKIVRAGGRSEFIDFSGPHSVIRLTHVGLLVDATLSFIWNGHAVRTKLIGLQYLQTVQAALAVGRWLEMSESELVKALESFTPNQSYIQSSRLSSGALVIDDGFSTNPTGFTAGLELLGHFKKQGKRTVLVTGGIVDLGESSSEIHAALAKKAAQVADEVWYVGTEGKSEFAQEFGAAFTEDVTNMVSRISELSQDVVVLLEGRIPNVLQNHVSLG
jgi:UDP-N-acetylmuramoyl-tripeptide--D-alanyl-D-alanine ligase